MGIRVTSGTFYKQYAQTVQKLKAEYNHSMEQVSSGQKFSSAQEDPLSYYAGKKLDNLYMDADAKDTVSESVKNRLYQQESGARAIQEEMRNINTKLSFINNDSGNTDPSAVNTVINEFKTRSQTIVNDMNATYENYYVYGGNDLTTYPFQLDASGNTFTFNHIFPGDTAASKMEMTLVRGDHINKDDYMVSDGNGGMVLDEDAYNEAYEKTDGGYSYSLEYKVTYADGSEATGRDAMTTILRAMSEQGHVDLGYGDIRVRDTLLDTNSGGLNMLTGITSNQVRKLANIDSATGHITGFQDTAYDNLDKYLMDSPIFLTAKAVYTTSDYCAKLEEHGNSNEVRSDMHHALGNILGKWQESENRVSNTYRESGVRYALLENTQKSLQLKMDTYQDEYDDRMGIDPYEAIAKMYSDQYAYNAAMQVGSKIMQNSLFDFVK
ncbi:hypothetical protein [[Clostridium] aminophilum]|uniref:Flagellin FlgL n=1 Tax=[Clostridium] aminophilum TaxID=1526 RepID=A0A1I6K0N8_9FIRM|nr:hypothetical protein [[Clostridium] aminophilum]SFR84744.1 Flagellin FlgL [[Clostridium] aminophilum]